MKRSSDFWSWVYLATFNILWPQDTYYLIRLCPSDGHQTWELGFLQRLRIIVSGTVGTRYTRLDGLECFPYLHYKLSSEEITNSIPRAREMTNGRLQLLPNASRPWPIICYGYGSTICLIPTSFLQCLNWIENEYRKKTYLRQATANYVCFLDSGIKSVDPPGLSPKKLTNISL